MSVRRTITVDIDFDLPQSGSIAEWREALADLERLVPPEYRDDVVISWNGSCEFDVPYAYCDVYYEKEETDEEVAARMAEHFEKEAARREAQIAYLKRQLAALES